MAPNKRGSKSLMNCYVTLTILLTSSLLGVVGIQITDLRVPPTVLNGSGSATLDCEFTLKPEELKSDSGLVVKWFFNNGPAPVYQWIPGQKPQELGILRGKLNVSHKASDNRATMYRALYIVNPTTELTGYYRCFVSTFGDEDFMTKKMVVYAPEKNMELVQTKPDMDIVNITCRAQGAYPEPKMALYKDRDRSAILEGVTVETVSRNGAYDIVATKLLEDRELESPTSFECEFRIPDAGYRSRKSIVYYAGMFPPGTGDANGLRSSGYCVLLATSFLLAQLCC